jgi:hypothetical protein
MKNAKGEVNLQNMEAINTQKFDLENRLVAFACLILDVCEMLPHTRAGAKPEYQLCKSGTAPALLYGEAQAAESRSDFLHKMKNCFKGVAGNKD